MIIAGALCIILALTSLQLFYMTDYAIGVVLFWSVLGSILIAKGIDKRKQNRRSQTPAGTDSKSEIKPEPAANPEIKPSPVVKPKVQVVSRPTVRAHRSVVFSSGYPVAGVTFNNDSGSSRQEILHSYCPDGQVGEAEAILDPYEYNGEQAIRVLTERGCVGNIRRDDVDEVYEIMDGQSQFAVLRINLFETDDGREIYRADVEPKV